MQGRGAREGSHKEERLGVVLGMKIQSNHVPNFIPGSSLLGQGWEATSSAILDSETSPEVPEPQCLVPWGPQTFLL